jgi:hypothetical protein
MDRSEPDGTAPRPITAALSYLIDTGEKPVFKASVGGGDANEYTAQFEAHEVQIADGRATPGGFGLDRQGFVLVEHETAVSDFYDETQVEGLYEAEVEALVKAVTGASRVVVFDHTLRSDAQATQVERNIREPASIVHNDYTPRSAPRRVRDILPAKEAEALLRGRFAIVNVWRSVAGPVSTSPLALCDARSVAPADLILSERRSKERVGEIQQAVFNPDHRWFYFPDMRRNEALLIKTYESLEDGRARFTIHTAFDNPTAPVDAAPRESIETRAFAFF